MTVLTLRSRFRTLLILVALLALLPAAASAQPVAMAPTPPAGVTRAVVARVYYNDKADLNAMGAELDVWTVAAREGYAVVLLQPEQYSLLITSGHRIEVDTALTAQVNAAPNESVPPDAGIPGYACYRTVEETYATMATLAANNPNLLTWTDTGNSWEKVTPGRCCRIRPVHDGPDEQGHRGAEAEVLPHGCDPCTRVCNGRARCPLRGEAGGRLRRSTRTRRG